MDTRVLALCELSNDLLFHKIPAEQLSFYVDSSLNLGTEAAASLVGRDIEELYLESGIEIQYMGDGKAAFGMAYRGQITLSSDTCSVVLFESSVKELSEHSVSSALAPVSYELAKKIHLAHEYFHYLEFQSNAYVSKILPDVITMQILGLKRKASINRCSEVAAHAFAKALLSLEVLPNYYDYRYLINTGQMTEAAFRQMAERYQAQLS